MTEYDEIEDFYKNISRIINQPLITSIQTPKQAKVKETLYVIYNDARSFLDDLLTKERFEELTSHYADKGEIVTWDEEAECWVTNSGIIIPEEWVEEEK